VRAAPTAKQFECLEAGCDFSCRAATDADLVTAVQSHMAEAHDSFELEDFILAGAVEVSADSNEARD
jgi:predicted small metal-binding protein